VGKRRWGSIASTRVDGRISTIGMHGIIVYWLFLHRISVHAGHLMNLLFVLLEFGLEFFDVILISFFGFGCTIEICALSSLIPGLSPVHRLQVKVKEFSTRAEVSHC